MRSVRRLITRELDLSYTSTHAVGCKTQKEELVLANNRG